MTLLCRLLNKFYFVFAIDIESYCEFLSLLAISDFEFATENCSRFWPILCWCRWAQFRQHIAEIDECLKRLSAGINGIAYKQSIGGGFYISVTSGFWCIDVRKFFQPTERQTSSPLVRDSPLESANGTSWKKLWKKSMTSFPLSGQPCRATYLKTTWINSAPSTAVNVTPSPPNFSELDDAWQLDLCCVRCCQFVCVK